MFDTLSKNIITEIESTLKREKFDFDTVLDFKHLSFSSIDPLVDPSAELSFRTVVIPGSSEGHYLDVILESRSYGFIAASIRTHVEDYDKVMAIAKTIKHDLVSTIDLDLSSSSPAP